MYEEVKTLVSGHLADLRDNRLPQIQRKTGFSLQVIQDAWDQLRTLNPKPGADFTAVSAPTVTPDVFLERNEDGTYRVYLEEGRTPSLRISNYYRQRLINGTATPEEKEFIKRKINAAQWLIEAIQQRRSTLDQGCPSHRRSSNQFHRKWTGSDRAVEDATDCGQSGCSCNDGESSG